MKGSPKGFPKGLANASASASRQEAEVIFTKDLGLLQLITIKNTMIFVKRL